MQGILRALAIAGALAALPALAQPAPEVTLTRLDCGNGFNDQRRFSDTFACTEPRVPFTFSCYLVRHGDDYMVWDTGYQPGTNPNAPTVSLLEQLAQLRIRPDRVKFVGISHFHADHTGQLGSLPGANAVVVLRTPGHTPGHQSLLVRLKEKGPVVLVGDAAHFHENYRDNGVPGFNHDRSDTIASLERIKQIEKNLRATVIIQHDPRDIGKLPAFPAAAR